MKFAYSLIILALLVSCSGNVKEVACTGQNWAEFGYKIGVEGRSVHEFDTYRSTCKDKLEKGALKAYLDGYTRGIMQFCTYENGYALGLKNQPANKNCPAELNAPFLKGHSVGRFELSERKRELDNSAKRLEEERMRIEPRNSQPPSSL